MICFQTPGTLDSSCSRCQISFSYSPKGDAPLLNLLTLSLAPSDILEGVSRVHAARGLWEASVDDASSFAVSLLRTGLRCARAELHGSMGGQGGLIAFANPAYADV